MLAHEFELEGEQRDAENRLENGEELRLLKSPEGGVYVFYRHQLFAQYQRNDNYTRNIILVQLFLCHKVSQKELSQAFGLTVPHLSRLVGKYRRGGSAGVEDNLRLRIINNKKIKGKIAEAIIKQLDVREEDRPTYAAVAKDIKRRYGVDISWNRIGNWWREYKKGKREAEEFQSDPEQLTLIRATDQYQERIENEAQEVEGKVEDNSTPIDDSWQANNVAGSFILYAMLEKSQFLKPFLKDLQSATNKGRKSIERVMLTLFFSHALRLKSIEQTKHLLSAHFGPLVLGDFSRQQSLRYAIDGITGQKKFDEVITTHYKNIGEQTDLGDDIYYTDGHFSCYYGKYAIPKGYDARRQRPARGRNTIYLHNSLGHNILSFESPTNTSLSIDIETLLYKMEATYGDVKGKTLFFDRGGFSANCFKAIKAKGMYFTTYLKYKKKGREVESELFEEVVVEVNGEKITNRLYEKERETKRYGLLRTVILLGRQGKQIPVITTNPTLSAAAIVAGLQKRWVEENGFKYMGEHFNIDLLTSYETEQAPDKIMSRPNPDRKAANQAMIEKKAYLNELKERYATKLNEVKDKDELTIAAFEEQEKKLRWSIKNVEVELGLIELKRKEIPSKVESNMKDESVISSQKRRLFINLVKTMNYNCEKWLQQLFIQHHPKADETLTLIRHVLTQPGRIRQRGHIFEVELERLDSEVQANSLDKVLENLKEHNYLKLQDGRELAIWQAP